MYVQGTESTITEALIDGGAAAVISPNNTAKFSTNGGGTAITYDPIYFSTANPTPPPPPKNLAAPQVGFDQGGTFTPIADPTNMVLGSLAFSSTPGTNNVLPPNNVAELTASNLGNPNWIMTPIVTQATASGDWHTTMSTQFGNGNYSVFMQQYLPQDWGLTNPVGEATQLLDFSVNLATLPLVAAGGGTALTLTPGAPGTTAGNWIDLTVSSSTLKNGTLIAYATDSSGAMLNRDGSGTTTSLVDATLAKIGAVAADNGQMFYTGQQSVYLPAGDNLKFAIITGDDVINLNPTTTVTGRRHRLAVSVAGSGGQINFTATVDNTLSESAVLAASQRTTDHARVYLTQWQPGAGRPGVERRLRQHGPLRAHGPEPGQHRTAPGRRRGLRQHRRLPRRHGPALGVQLDPGQFGPERRRPSGPWRAAMATTRRCWSIRSATSSPSTPRRR